MDQEVYRLALALVLTGLVFFAWQYYRGILREKPSEPVEIRQQIEKTEFEKTAIRKDLSNYKNCGHLKIMVYPIYKALEFLYKRIKNLGIALILLTLGIRILIAPFMFKQVQNSKKLQHYRVRFRR